MEQNGANSVQDAAKCHRSDAERSNALLTAGLSLPVMARVVVQWPRSEAAFREVFGRQSEEDKLSSSILTYKVLRNPGQGPWSSWKTVTERVEGMTREDMLDIRAKNKADRYCK